MTGFPSSLSEAAVAVLSEPSPGRKIAFTRSYAAAWRDGDFSEVGSAQPPERPARPKKPELRRPGDMPKRKTGSPEGRIALIHAITHIELNAIDLAWDIIARFAANEEMPSSWSSATTPRPPRKAATGASNASASA